MTPVVDETAARRAIDAKTKPLGALGRLEELAVRLSVLQQTLSPVVDHARVCVFAADHGVSAEGVSAYPRAVTAEMMRNFSRGGAAINVLARANGVEVDVIDVGVDADLTALENIRPAKVRNGSRNLLIEPAMSDDELRAAMEVGVDAARRAAASGVTALGLGEMGIGNTTSAAALLSALIDRPASVTVGRGTGVSDAALARKHAVVDAAVALHTRDGKLDAREYLRRLGGLEIAAIAGAVLEGARLRLAVVADGFISTVATLAAIQMATEDSDESLARVRSAVFFAHRSTESGHAAVLRVCERFVGPCARPLLDLEMRLGEGTGAALAMSLLRSAADVMRTMATFASAEVSAGEHAAEHSAER